MIRRSPAQGEPGRHPFAGLDRVNDDELSGLDLAGPDHLVQMDQSSRPADITYASASELNLFARDAQTVQEGGNVIFIELERRNGNDIVIDLAGRDSQAGGKPGQTFEQERRGRGFDGEKLPDSRTLCRRPSSPRAGRRRPIPRTCR